MASPKEIIPLIVAHANYYGVTLGDEVVRMYASDLEEFDFETLQRAYAKYRKNPKNFRNPLPAQIKAIIEPEMDERGAALDLANRLCAAAEKHDNYWVKYDSFREEFLNELGVVAWNVVQKRGGWSRFCDQYWGQDRGQFVAQLRDLIEYTSATTKPGDALPMQSLPGGPTKSLTMEQIEKMLVASWTIKEPSGGTRSDSP